MDRLEVSGEVVGEDLEGAGTAGGEQETKVYGAMAENAWWKGRSIAFPVLGPYEKSEQKNEND